MKNMIEKLNNMFKDTQLNDWKSYGCLPGLSSSVNTLVCHLMRQSEI